MRRAALFFVLLLAGCARDPVGLDLWDLPKPPPTPSLQWLGVGGFLLHWKGEGLLFAPSFSNPAMPPLRVVPDHEKIDRLMPPADDVTMLLVGHGHYDHLLDVPWVMQKHTPKAKAYGSRTVGRILRAELPASRIVNAEASMARVGTPGQPGNWLYSDGGHLRAMAIESRHSPHLDGVVLFDGEVGHDLKRLPTAVWNWKTGQSLAWLVDLLDDQGRVVYRIHYQDSASRPPYGFPPVLGDDKRIDVEILCVGNWDKVTDYPGALLRLTKPRLVVLGHWEDFFGNDINNPQVIRLLDAQGMVAITKANLPADAVMRMPKPLSFIPLPAPQ